jgi:hypothetical protein
MVCTFSGTNSFQRWKPLDDDSGAYTNTIAQLMIPSCGSEVDAYFAVTSEKVAKILREGVYGIAIQFLEMNRQTRNRDYEFWNRDEPQTRNRDYGFCSGDEQIRPIPWSEWGRNGAIHPVIRCDCDRHPEYC